MLKRSLSLFVGQFLLCFLMSGHTSAQQAITFPATVWNEEITFHLGRFLGSGRTTNVYELSDYPDRVIRLESKSQWYIFPRYFDGTYINKTIKEYDFLLKTGIPMVRIHDYRYGQYVVVDYVEGPTFETFVTNPEKFSAEERAVMEKRLIEFARLSHRLRHIGGFKPEQIMYDPNKGWLLIDWMNGSQLAKSPYDEYSIFSNFFFHWLGKGFKGEHRIWYDSLLEKLHMEARNARLPRFNSNLCSGLF